MKKGFTLIEVIVSVAIFSILAVSALGLYATMIKAITFYRGQTTVSALADQYLEIARNLPYAKVGTQNGNPHGPLPDFVSPLELIFNGINYQVYYVVNALHDDQDPNVGVQDYKQIKLYIKNSATDDTASFSTIIAPIDLASMGSGGVLLVQVIDKTWQPVPGAVINITNTNISPTINLSRTSDSDGRWYEIGLPADSNYHVMVTKNGYSSDQTYPADEYPGAANQDAMIIQGEVSQITLAIDHLSNLVFRAISQTCQPISGVEVNVQGAKTIVPGLSKFDEVYTSGSGGAIYPESTSVCSSTCGSSECCLEWDNYTPDLESSSYMVYGTSPVQSVNLLPDSSQNFNLILGPKTDNSLLVVVKDTVGNPIEGAVVELEGLVSGTAITGGSVWAQNNWTGGSGQTDFEDETKYYGDDGGVSSVELPQALRLLKQGEFYVNSGQLVSSSFDTGTEDTQYTTLNWQPEFQTPGVEIKFQLAANSDNETWDFKGPDGTSGSYYTVSGSAISSQLNNKRYVRYKVFLSTTDQAITPVLSGVSVNYVSGCPAPGQAIFAELPADNGYYATISNDEHGYLPQTIGPLDVNGYFVLQVTLLQE